MSDNIYTNGIKVNNKNLKAEANVVKDLIIKLNDNNINTIDNMIRIYKIRIYNVWKFI